MSPLASELLQVHMSRKSAAMFATQALINQQSLINLDAAYNELMDAGAVEQASGIVSVGSVPRKPYRLKK